VIDSVVAPATLAPGIEVVDAPGHNPGHFAVRIESGDDLAIVPGHLVLSPIQVDDPGFDVGDADLALATVTRRAILGELADRGGLLLTTLMGGSGGGRVRADGDGYALMADHLAV
jgi:glyoxylase-like metal-dependent hydrolase (beta-lactamase superfamily II)